MAELTARTVALQQALREALDEVSPSPRRPVDLVRQLGLDKSLASKLVKLSDDEDPLRGLRDGPGIPGLRLLGRSLSERGLAIETGPRLTSAIDALEAAINRIPEGRAGLDAALAGAVASGSDRLHREARQAIFKATVLLTGWRIESSYQVYALMPSRTIPDKLDMMIVHQRGGVRRLRRGSRSIVLALPTPSRPTGGPLTLTGEPARGPREAILPRFCSPKLPELIEVERNGTVLMGVEAGIPDPSEEITLATGVHAIGHWRRHHVLNDPDGTHDYVGVLTRRPTRLLVMDLLLPRALGIHDPVATITVAGLSAPTSPQVEEFDAIEQEAVVQAMGVGSAGLACRGVPDARAMAETAIKATGIPPSDFDAYRLLIEHPLPNTSTRLWVRLPEAATA